MTATGSSAQYRSTMSTGAVVSASSSSRASAVSWTPARIASTARAVNTDDTRRRYRVWSGGSTASSDGGRSGCNASDRVCFSIHRRGAGRRDPRMIVRKSSERSVSNTTA